MTANPILSGAFSDVDLSSVMAAVSLGRQLFRLEILNAREQLVGYLVVKGGRVVHAKAGGLANEAAVEFLLGEAAGARFRVVPESRAPRALTSFASIGELVGDAASRGSGRLAKGSTPVPLSSRVHILAGSLSEFDVATLLQTVCLGRQSTELEVLDVTGRRIGSVRVKGAKVVSATAGTLDGLEAIHELLDAPGEYRFAVFRLESDDVPPSPLGSLMDVLLSRPEPTERRRPLPGGAARVCMLAGSLSEFDVRTVIQTICIGRQCTELEILHDDGRANGLLQIKGGRILAARAGDRSGIAALRELVRSATGGQFAVYRLDASSLEGMEPLGSVNELLLAVADPPRRRPASVTTRYPQEGPARRIRMLAGSLAEFDVPTLLQTVCIGRQSTLLDILDADGRALGSVHVKGAKVVSATAGTLRGFDAIRILINAPGTWQFVVSRSPTPVDDVEPIGSVAEVLFEAPDVERRPENLATVNGTAVDAPRELGPAKKRESQRAVMAATSGDRKSRRRRRALVAAPVAVAIAASALLAVFGPSSTPRPAPVAPEVHAGLAPSPPVPAPSDSSPAPAAPPTSPATPTPVPAAPLPEPPVAAAHHDRAPLATVEDVQIALTSLGYAPGPIDNKRGPLTRRAIRAFQRDAGLRVTGRPDAPTLDAIGERLAPSVD